LIVPVTAPPLGAPPLPPAGLLPAGALPADDGLETADGLQATATADTAES